MRFICRSVAENGRGVRSHRRLLHSWGAFFGLVQRKRPRPRKKFASVLNQPNHAVIWLPAYRQWELSQSVLVHRRPRRRGFHIPRFRTSPKARSLHRSSSLPEKRTSLAGTKSLRVPLTGGEYNLAVPLVNLATAEVRPGCAALTERLRCVFRRRSRAILSRCSYFQPEVLGNQQPQASCPVFVRLKISLPPHYIIPQIRVDYNTLCVYMMKKYPVRIYAHCTDMRA